MHTRMVVVAAIGQDTYYQRIISRAREQVGATCLPASTVLCASAATSFPSPSGELREDSGYRHSLPRARQRREHGLVLAHLAAVPQGRKSTVQLAYASTSTGIVNEVQGS